MPPLDEGSILDMPVTVPRASVTETTDDLKARDALLRRFPEVEMIVGKSGRADTPTDPSPLDMVESVITLRPKEYWPRRKLRYEDAERQTEVVLAALQQRRPDRAHRRQVRTPRTARSGDDERHPRGSTRRCANWCSERFTRIRGEPGTAAAAGVHRGAGRRWQKAGRLLAPVPRPTSTGWPPGCETDSRRSFPPVPGRKTSTGSSSKSPRSWRRRRRWNSIPSCSPPSFHPLHAAYLAVANVLGSEQPTLFTEMFDFIEKQRDKHWREQVRQRRSRHLRLGGRRL